MAATDHLQLQLFDPDQSQLFDPYDYRHRYQGGKVTTSREERDEHDAYLTQQQQQQPWFRRYGKS